MIIDMGADRREDITWRLNPLSSEFLEKSKPMKGGNKSNFNITN
jgi:hypothetical protein